MCVDRYPSAGRMGDWASSSSECGHSPASDGSRWGRQQTLVPGWSYGPSEFNSGRLYEQRGERTCNYRRIIHAAEFGVLRNEPGWKLIPIRRFLMTCAKCRNCGGRSSNYESLGINVTRHAELYRCKTCGQLSEIVAEARAPHCLTLTEAKEHFPDAQEALDLLNPQP